MTMKKFHMICILGILKGELTYFKYIYLNGNITTSCHYGGLYDVCVQFDVF